MLLGVPVVTTDIGGITSMITPEEGIIYEGFRVEKGDEPSQLQKISDRLANAVLQVFENPQAALERGQRARKHARITHDGKVNNKRLLEIYEAMMLCK